MKIALLLGSASSYGGQPMSAARLVGLLSDYVRLVPLWLEAPVKEPRVEANGHGYRLYPPKIGTHSWLREVLADYHACHLHGVFIWAAHLAVLPDTIIVSYRGSDLNLGVYRQPAYLHALTRKATVCTFLNPMQMTLARRLFRPDCPLMIVPNHKSVREVEPATLDLPKPIICCVNEFRRVTGLDYLLDAFQRLGRGSLLLVGPLHAVDAPYYSKRLQGIPHVYQTGRVSGERVLQLMKASDIAVFPSVSEGMPNKVLEAFSVGLPVIGSDVAGIQCLIDDQIHGRLFRSRDSEHLYQVLREALEAPASVREGWSANALQRLLLEHTEEKEREGWLTCYRAAGLLS